MTNKTLKEGFEKFVVRHPQGCWDWKGTCPKNPGYGQFRSNMKIYRAHKASWIIHNGEIPKGMFVCHHCDNKRCSNQEHLFLGTCKENNLDSIKKNINPCIGKKRDLNHKTKIYSKDFDRINELYLKGYSQMEISKMYNVSQSNISVVLRKLQEVGY